METAQQSLETAQQLEQDLIAQAGAADVLKPGTAALVVLVLGPRRTRPWPRSLRLVAPAGAS